MEEITRMQTIDSSFRASVASAILRFLVYENLLMQIHLNSARQLSICEIDSDASVNSIMSPFPSEGKSGLYLLDKKGGNYSR
jgi:hypothetical protein